MDVRIDPALEEFADEVRTWIEEHCVGEFAAHRGRGLTGQEDVPVEVQLAWEKELAGGGWLGIDFPESIGGRGCTLAEQVVFHKTYIETRAPGRLPNVGVTLLGPTLMAFGTAEQQQRFVPPILSGDEYWCQGYSEPDAGSDLANVKTRAEAVDGRWVVNGRRCGRRSRNTPIGSSSSPAPSRDRPGITASATCSSPWHNRGSRSGRSSRSRAGASSTRRSSATR